MAAPSASAAKPSAATSCGQPGRETVRGTLRAGVGSHLPLPRAFRLMEEEAHDFSRGRFTIYPVHCVGMSRMFDGCRSLESLDMSHMDVSFVDDTEHMPRGCESLRTLSLPEDWKAMEKGFLSKRREKAKERRK